MGQGLFVTLPNGRSITTPFGPPVSAYTATLRFNTNRALFGNAVTILQGLNGATPLFRIQARQAHPARRGPHAGGGGDERVHGFGAVGGDHAMHPQGRVGMVGSDHGSGVQQAAQFLDDGITEVQGHLIQKIGRHRSGDPPPVTAQSGSGNLLGNQLRAVAHLLDSNASTTALARLLNQILAAL